jgi:hypothetical protein
LETFCTIFILPKTALDVLMSAKYDVGTKNIVINKPALFSFYEGGLPMSLFRVYVDGALFYHPQMSKLAITAARIEEDAENIDSMTLSAPFNHPYLSAVRPLASTIVCKKGDAVVFEGRALNNGTDFYNTHTWTCDGPAPQTGPNTPATLQKPDITKLERTGTPGQKHAC